MIAKRRSNNKPSNVVNLKQWKAANVWRPTLADWRALWNRMTEDERDALLARFEAAAARKKREIGAGAVVLRPPAAAR